MMDLTALMAAAPALTHTERLARVNAFISERPRALLTPPVLERLADVLLYDDLADRSSGKARGNSPIMSAHQELRRRSAEYALNHADMIDEDGRSQRTPRRRHRLARELRFLDEAEHTKNRARNAQYKRDTAAGLVYSGRTRSDWRKASGASAAWQAYINR